MHLKKEKCRFLMTEVEYLGHQITSQGLQASHEKVQVIRDAPTPKKVTELRAFLGLINPYGKFLPNILTTLSPLYKLLKKEAEWKQSSEQEAAFKQVKRMFDSLKLLDHYNGSKPLQLSCVASPYAVGAVLTHSSLEGPQRLLAFVSQMLTPVEAKYSQLDKEALVITYGVKHFHSYSNCSEDNSPSIQTTDRSCTFLERIGECQQWLQPGSMQ